ncbi:uncharacterized protein LOC144934034 [Lampetra fluviatilis]
MAMKVGNTKWYCVMSTREKKAHAVPHVACKAAARTRAAAGPGPWADSRSHHRMAARAASPGRPHVQPRSSRHLGARVFATPPLGVVSPGSACFVFHEAHP